MLADVLDEKVTSMAAERDYGVVLAGSPLAVEQAATEALRARAKSPHPG